MKLTVDKDQLRKYFLILTAAVLVAVLLIYLFYHGPKFFNRHDLKQIFRLVHSFGIFAPIGVFLLILLSTIIPPLPLPIPLIEITSGLFFGFWGGFFLVWFSQISSSIAAFYISRFFGKKFFGPVINNKIWDFYHRYLDKKGPMAVLISRATMSSPFNITSYMAGITKMGIGSFALATVLGTIPEALIFTFAGSELRDVGVGFLWLLFLVILITGFLGLTLTFLTMTLVRSKLE